MSLPACYHLYVLSHSTSHVCSYTSVVLFSLSSKQTVTLLFCLNNSCATNSKTLSWQAQISVEEDADNLLNHL